MLESQSPQASTSLSDITSQKQFEERQNQSDHAEVLGNYADESNATEKMA